MHALWRSSAKRTRSRNGGPVPTEGEERPRGSRHVHLFVDCMYPTCTKKRSRAPQPQKHKHKHQRQRGASSSPVPLPRVTTYLEPATTTTSSAALPSTEITLTTRTAHSLTSLAGGTRVSDVSDPSCEAPPTTVSPGEEEGNIYHYSSSNSSNKNNLSQDRTPMGDAITTNGVDAPVSTAAALSQYVEGDFTEELSGLELDDMDNMDIDIDIDIKDSYQFTNGNGLRMDDETRRWTGNEREDEFVALEAADERHRFARCEPEHDDAMFSEAPTREWIEDTRRHNCNPRLRPQPPLDIRQLAAYM